MVYKDWCGVNNNTYFIHNNLSHAKYDLGTLDDNL